MQIRLTEIAKLVNGEIRGDETLLVSNAAAFEAATASEIVVAGTAAYLKKIDQTEAGVVIVARDFEHPTQTLLRVDNPQIAFARVVALFFQPQHPSAGIPDSACIGDDCLLGDDLAVGDCAVIGNRVSIGNRSIIYPHVYIGDDVVIGDDAVIYPHVTILERCRIGHRAIVQSGTVVGSDGYGYAQDGPEFKKIPQTGIVKIEDDVEIGACNTIDRATFGATLIGKGVKTDNLVHIAHNVQIGQNTVIVAQVGISGSAKIGKQVILAGQVGVVGHLEIGDKAMIGAQSGVGQSVPEGAILSGSPAYAHSTWLRVQRLMPQLPDMAKRLRKAEKKVAELEKRLSAK
jgi:UDP-3-O-[3-hydroxymyristoyl] glucosamine N-acyltransferase